MLSIKYIHARLLSNHCGGPVVLASSFCVDFYPVPTVEDVAGVNGLGQTLLGFFTLPENIIALTQSLFWPDYEQN